MFSHESVILFTGGCVADTPLWAEPPPGKHPPADPLPRQTPPTQCMLGYTHPLPSAYWDTPPPGCHCGGRYASYWNAFLFYGKSHSEVRLLMESQSCHWPVYQDMGVRRPQAGADPGFWLGVARHLLPIKVKNFLDFAF